MGFMDINNEIVTSVIFYPIFLFSLALGFHSFFVISRQYIKHCRTQHQFENHQSNCHY
jgi:hypothetical protein